MQLLALGSHHLWLSLFLAIVWLFFHFFLDTPDYDILPISYSPLTIEQASDLISLEYSASRKYLLVLPYEGITNQLVGILRGLLLAHVLNRTLILPPLIRSQHESSQCILEEPWNYWLDWDSLVQRPQLHRVQIQKDKYAFPSHLSVFSFGKWRQWKSFGNTTWNYLKIQHHRQGYISFRLGWRPFRAPLYYQHLLDYLKEQHHNTRFLALSQLQHVHFPSFLLKEVYPLTREFLRCPALLSSMGNEAYLGVHWRQGDFSIACKNKSRRTRCYSRAKDVLASIIRIKRNYGYKQVWLASDATEDDVKYLGHLLEQASIVMNRSSRNCTDRYMDDICGLINSHYFLDNPYSTLSRLVKSIRQNNNSQKGMKKSGPYQDRTGDLGVISTTL